MKMKFAEAILTLCFAATGSALAVLYTFTSERLDLWTVEFYFILSVPVVAAALAAHDLYKLWRNGTTPRRNSLQK
jgi:hypothetical protein